MARIYGTKSTTGLGTAIIAAPPAGQEIKISFRILQSLSSTPTTIMLNAGGNVLEGIYCDSTVRGVMGVLPGGTAIRCGNGQALYIEQDQEVPIHWSIGYNIVPYDAGG